MEVRDKDKDVCNFIGVGKMIDLQNASAHWYTASENLVVGGLIN